ncbi:hypothetical protein BRC83_09130 [Halobacteriales archaeon QS_1_68_17]|nr:MAG: hypothetical protein BRC83_09130 [Halobacteriales archaeon QS_1_68_17]
MQSGQYTEPRVRISRQETVSEEALVCDYDQLSERARQRLPGLVASEGDVGRVGLAAAAELTRYDAVKFTDYYRIDWR